MTILETILSLATLLLGGGCVTMFATLKSTRAKASEDVKAARIDNAEELLRLNQQFIVEPITTKIITLERTIKKLERAINKSKDCEHRANCPVRNEINNHENN